MGIAHGYTLRQHPTRSRVDRLQTRGGKASELASRSRVRNRATARASPHAGLARSRTARTGRRGASRLQNTHELTKRPAGNAALAVSVALPPSPPGPRRARLGALEAVSTLNRRTVEPESFKSSRLPPITVCERADSISLTVLVVSSAALFALRVPISKYSRKYL
jgi:hypothetical protein